jgi:hypothetical protein
MCAHARHTGTHTRTYDAARTDTTQKKKQERQRLLLLSSFFSSYAGAAAAARGGGASGMSASGAISPARRASHDR